MSASVKQLLDDLEIRLEKAQQTIAALEAHNRQLTRQLAGHAPAQPPLDTPAPELPATPTPPPAATPTPPSPHQLLEQWYQRYPQAFSRGRTLPLKVGIHQDLAEREAVWSNKLIRRALANYVNLPRYVKAMQEGVERVDLEGNPAGVVDAQAAEFAARKRQARQKTAPSSANRPPSTPGRKASDSQAGEQPATAKPRGQRPAPGKRAPAQPDAAQPPGADTQKPPAQALAESAQASGAGRQPMSMEEKLASLQAKFQTR
ncbi:ProQ/FINO family protein [Halomonas sp. BLK-85]